MKSLFKTAFLLTLLTLLFIWLGAAIGGQTGMITAFCFALVMNFIAYWFSDKIVLAMYRAQPAEPGKFPQLYRIVSELSLASSLPMPKIYIIPIDTPNAFATGRDPNHAAVAVTYGILKMLSEDELKGVLSHEMAHVKNRDILIQSVVATIAGAISMIANMARWAALGSSNRNRRGNTNVVAILIMSILAPIAAMLIQLAISRSREYQADESGAHISRAPLSLANALKKLTLASKQIPFHNANPNTAHLFIVNPLSGRGLVSLFSTHPPLEERIARLEKMSKGI